MSDSQRNILISIVIILIIVGVLWLVIGSNNNVTNVAEANTATATPNTSPTYTSTSPTQTATPTTTSTIAPPTATTQPSSSPSPSPLSSPTTQPTTIPTEVPLTPTALPEPTATPTPSPTPTPELPDWLVYLNMFREQAGLTHVSENVAWSLGAQFHSQYMVQTGRISHSQDPTAYQYTDQGNEAGENGNIAATSWTTAPTDWPIDFWMSAPFHAVPMLDPRLQEVGYGYFRETFQDIAFAGTLDVLRGLDDTVVSSVEYPVLYPKDGGETWILNRTLSEWPEPLAVCSGYSLPTGPPIVVFFGDGSGIPTVVASSIINDSSWLPHCVIHESNYWNAEDSAAQTSGINILGVRDAIVLIPRYTLKVGETYTVHLETIEAVYNWSFTAIEKPE